MVTIFTIPKAFDEKFGLIQENAIKSWKELHSEIEIILFGDEVGIEEICKKYNIIHFPNIIKNENNTPYLDNVFEKVQFLSKIFRFSIFR